MSKAKFTEAEVAEALFNFEQTAELVKVTPLSVFSYHKDVYTYKEPENGSSQGSSN